MPLASFANQRFWKPLFLAACVLFGGLMLAQDNPNTNQGMKPYDSFHGGALDSVSVTSGNLFFHKTEYAAPQRGNVGLSFSLQYNNKGFQLQIVCVNGSRGPWESPLSTSSNPSNGGTGCDGNYFWHWVGNGVGIVLDQETIVGSQYLDSGQQNGHGQEVYVYTYSAQTSDGSRHQLADTGNGYRAIDASGIRWNGAAPNSAQDRNGMYDGGQLDANGNFLSVDLSTHNWTDTLGRTIPSPSAPPDTSTASLNSCPNLNLAYQPVTYAYYWDVPGPTGTSRYLLCYASVYIRTAFFFAGTYVNTTNFKDVSRSVNMLQSVVRPDGTVWTFTYDAANPSDATSIAYGDLLKIGFPMGGSIAYTYVTAEGYRGYYENGLQTQESRSVATRTVDANDGNGPHTWTYNWGAPLSGTGSNYVVENTVTDPLGNDTVHQMTGLFGGPSLYETQTRYYQGSQTSGTLLKTVNTDYSYSSNPFDQLGSNVNPPTAINVVPIRVTTILANGLTTKEETDHDSSFTFRDPLWGAPVYPPMPSQSYTYSGTLGTVSARREYDYGSSSGGNLLRQTFTTYRWQASSNYLDANLLDLPSSVVIQDGGGNRVAETDYSYDEPQYLTSSQISAQHGNAPNAVRGNLTTVSKWLNTSASPVVTHTNWYDTGEVYKSFDALANTTTHSYDPAYAGAYSTMTCNALSQCVSGTYDFNTGLLTSFTDANGSYPANGTTPGDAAHTSNYNYDNMLRMTQALFPPDTNGQRPETDFVYPNATTVQRCKKQNANSGSNCSNWIVDYAYFDGLGRTIQTRSVDPEGDDYVDTKYDALGRVSTVSNPHRTAASATDGITTTYYDALGRVIQTTKQDGSMTVARYDLASGNTNCTLTTDEAGKSRKACADALGRLVEVDEPQPSSIGTSATASVTISGGLASYQTAAPPPAMTGSGLAGFADSSGSQHWAYLASNGHLYNLYWTSSGGYGFDDVTAATGAPAASGTVVTGFPSGAQQWAYFGSNGHVYNFWWNGSYGYQDATAGAGAPAAVAGSPLIGFADSGAGQHWAYFGTNQHVYNVYWSGGYGYGDVTGTSGAPAAASGSALTAFGDSSGGQHWSYLGSNQHVYNLYWTAGTGYGYQDATAGGSAPVASSTSRLAGFADASGGQHWTYLDANGHGYNLYWNCCGSYGYSDLTSATGAPAASGNAIAGFMDSGGSQHWAYFTSSLDVLNFWSSNGSYGYQNATAGAGAPAATTGSALAGFKDPWGGQHWAYFGTNQHVYNVWWNNGSYGYQDVNASTDLVYDAGTVSLNVGGFTVTVCYGHSTNSACTGQPVNTTTAQVAAALANAVNVASSPATALVSGSTISLTWKVPGPFTPSVSALSTTHDNPGQFTNPSFTSPATNFANGTGNLGSNPYVTLYSYDTLGNLLRVDQKGTAPSDSSQWRTRLFTYDSLSRLLTAYNPESGTISYSYDADSNVLQKTSPAPNQTGSATQTISYCYDKINRITSKQYVATSCPLSSPVVTYTYDSGTNGIGRLTSLTDQAGSGSYSYDALGRIATEQRTIAGVQKSLSYVYYLDNSIQNLTYPSGATVTYTPDPAGHMVSAIDNGNNIQYVTGATYGPDSSVAGFVSGHSSTFAGITSSFSFNKRLQPVLMSATAPNQTVFSIGYDFHIGNGDNGNVFSLINYRDQSRTQTFTYDALNRLTWAQNAGTDCTKTTVNGKAEYWGNSYGYDAWGNLLNKTPSKCSAENLNEAAWGSNQLHTISGPDNTYDAAGNMTHDATTSLNYTYDAENRITGAGGYSYTYDADGNRVEKSNGSTGTIYWYMLPGIVAESDLTGALKSEYVFFDGERVARKDFPGNTVSYYFSDHLKTASVITDSAGNVTEDEDYYPWGGELQFVNNDSNHYKFTGKERDGETGLDYFGARYYGNWLGRWMSPDWAAKPAAVPYAVLGDPQTLNLYEYVRNNPIEIGDADGHNWFTDQAKHVAVGFAKGLGAMVTFQPARFDRTRLDTFHSPSDQRIQQENSRGRIPEVLHPHGTAETIGFAMAVGTSVLPGAKMIQGMFRGVGAAAATEELLQGAANRAAARVGSGSGPVYGTAVHSEFAGEVNALGNPNLTTEQSYLHGVPVKYGTPGSIRLDVVEGPLTAPTAVYDLKTGSASLTQGRIQQIQSNLPPASKNIPIKEIRPQ